MTLTDLTDEFARLPQEGIIGPNDSCVVAILCEVLVEQDAGLGIAQQPRQRSLPVEERETAKILAIMFDQVECIDDRGVRCLSSAQLVEP
jgi:hypothetical protein